MSDENRLRMRPSGVVSKKPIGARVIARKSFPCISRETRRAPRMNHSARNMVARAVRRAKPNRIPMLPHLESIPVAPDAQIESQISPPCVPSCRGGDGERRGQTLAGIQT